MRVSHNLGGRHALCYLPSRPLVLIRIFVTSIRHQIEGLRRNRVMWNPKLTKPKHQQEQSPDNSSQAPRLIFATDNLILASLSREVANKIASVSKPVPLNAGDMIYEGGDEI